MALGVVLGRTGGEFTGIRNQPGEAAAPLEEEALAAARRRRNRDLGLELELELELGFGMRKARGLGLGITDMIRFGIKVSGQRSLFVIVCDLLRLLVCVMYC